MPGVVRTRVGYAGGTTRNPTYRSIGDHAETIQIEFDLSKTSYAELLGVFWSTHNPCARSWSRQYMSAIFWHDEGQRKLAEESAARIARERGEKVETEILPFRGFTVAEDYHQKYGLRGARDLFREISTYYPDPAAFRESTAAARLNCYLAGSGEPADFERDLPRLGLSERAREALRERWREARG
ncbi:MAG: peptide-methionine (S)-S-oxide reductase [Planctomycetales bacterium]|nr:peptide-methionine (S)-S-oxide reductase [Planctomycetales bacterium]